MSKTLDKWLDELNGLTIARNGVVFYNNIGQITDREKLLRKIVRKQNQTLGKIARYPGPRGLETTGHPWRDKARGCLAEVEKIVRGE